MSGLMRGQVGQGARTRCVALALTVAGCASFEPPPSKTAADLLAAGDPGGALDAVSGFYGVDEGTRERVARAAIAAAGPMITVDVIPQDELRKNTGIHLLRAVDPAWVFLRVQGSARNAAFGAVEARVRVTSEDKELLVLGKDAKSLTLLTGETYPPETEHWRLTTADFPWPVHVLTAGVLTVLTARVETTYSRPPEEIVRAAVPRALLLQNALAGSCANGPCDHRFVLRRPQREDAPLSLDVAVTVKRRSGAVVSAVATVPVPEGGRLEERLARAATRLAVAELPGASVALGSGAMKDRSHCNDNELVRSRDPACAPSAPWPTDEMTPLGLELPKVPERLGTPKESLAARPPWVTGDDYAPMPRVASLDASLPVPAQVEGGVLACDTQAFDVPGDDADRVFAKVTIDGRTSTVSRVFALPLLSLGPKSKVTVSFFDSDWLSGSDLLASIALKRDGATMAGSVGSAARLDRAHVSVKCRIFDRGAVEAAFAKAWYRAEDALDASVESPVVVHPEKRDFGFGGSPLFEAQRRVTDAAAFVGWSDPRVARLVSRRDEQENRFWLGVRRAIEGLKTDPSGRVVLERHDPPEGKIHGARLRCGDAVKREIAAEYDAGYFPDNCVVDIDFENLDRYPMYPKTLADRSQIVYDDGYAFGVAVLGGDVIAPGARAKLSFVPERTPRHASRAAKPWKFIVRGFRWTEIVPLSPP